MPAKIYSCFALVFSSLLFALDISVFLINFKTTPEVSTNLKLTLHDYKITISINKTIYYLNDILLLSGDIELNPGPKTPFFTFVHWNFYSHTFYNHTRSFTYEDYANDTELSKRILVN